MTGTSVHGLYNACTMKTGVTICFYLFVFIIYTVTRTVIIYIQYCGCPTMASHSYYCSVFIDSNPRVCVSICWKLLLCITFQMMSV